MTTDKKPTETQERSNISTEHQEPGDARLPRDTLDREPKRNPAGRPVPRDEAGRADGEETSPSRSRDGRDPD